LSRLAADTTTIHQPNEECNDMTAIVLPDIDRSTLEELKKRIPDLSEIDLNLPSRKEVGKTADQAIDRLLGRSRAPVWPWVAAVIGVAAVVGVVGAWFAWFRRPTWQLETPAGGASGVSESMSGWPGDTPLTGDPDEADAAFGDAPTASAARATVVRASGMSVEEA
jgi:hypothetical protein